MITELKKLSNHLNSLGLKGEVDRLSFIIEKIAEDRSDWLIHELKNHETGQSYFYDTQEKRLVDANRGEGERILAEAFSNWDARQSSGWSPSMEANSPWSLTPVGDIQEEQRPGPIAQPEQRPTVDPSDIAWFEGSREHQSLQNNFSLMDITLSAGDRALWNTFVRNWGDGAVSFPKPPFAPVIITINEKRHTENEVRFTLAKITKKKNNQEEPFGWEFSWKVQDYESLQELGSYRSTSNKSWDFVLDQIGEALEIARGFNYNDPRARRKGRLGRWMSNVNPFGRD
jgi:hypothetical protein